MSPGAEPSALLPAEVFHFMQGSWTVEREVCGRAVMAGTARVRATAEGAAELYERLAVRTTNGGEFVGSQRYEMRQTADGFALYFIETNLLFQDVRFARGGNGELRAEATHRCGGDCYESTYVIGRDGEFSLRHTVRGPRKNYSLISTFRRVGMSVREDAAWQAPADEVLEISCSAERNAGR